MQVQDDDEEEEKDEEEERDALLRTRLGHTPYDTEEATAGRASITPPRAMRAIAMH